MKPFAIGAALLGLGALAACLPGAQAGEACETPTRLEGTVCADGLACIAAQATGTQNPGRCWRDCAQSACPAGCSCGTSDVATADGGTRPSALHCIAAAGSPQVGCAPPR